jgi:NADPH:quinone reductase
MRAIQLDAPGPPEALHVRDLPIPEPKEGWVRIRVEAFGLNRSELHLRLGLSEGVSFPRVPGIECVGVAERVRLGGRRARTQFTTHGSERRCSRMRFALAN